MSFISRNRSSRRHVGASSSALAVALVMAMGSTSALAQTASAPAAAEDETTKENFDVVDEDPMIVTGFKASLQSATNEKRRSSQIVESVTAEDIGKLPDASIGESIARLPGLTSQRLNGRANVISIRGFGPDLSTTLLNGREQTSTGDSRGVEFDQYPSEIINQVVVYKSPIASLIGQGLAGTVDIRTVRPLNVKNRVISVGARGVYADLGGLNAGSSPYGFRVNGAFIDKFANDTIGVALAASYVNESYQNQQFNAWGYTDGVVPGAQLIGGNRSFVQSTKLSRIGVTGTVQWQPQPELTFTADGFYSHFNDNQINRGIELPLGFSVNGNNPATPADERLTPGFFSASFDPATAVVRGGQVVSGRFPTVEGVVRNDPFERVADLYSFGFNGAWEGNDGWNASFDFGYSRTDRNELSIESYSGTGYGPRNFTTGAGGAVDSIAFVSGPRGTSFTPTLNYSDASLIRLTDPLGWGGARPQVGYYNNRIVSDELKQYRVKVEREIDGSFISSVQFGMGYIDRDKSLTPDESIIRLANGATELALPAQFRLRPTNLSYLGLGPILSYDPRALLAAGGIYTLESNAVPDVLQKQFSVSENLLQTYLQANLKQDIGSATLTGNFGVQVVFTDQNSSGVVFTGDGLNAVRTPTTRGANYLDVLPSINLTLELPGEWIFRFAASREVQRPRLDDLRVALGYGYDQAQQTINGGGGNPELRPYRANAYDLNIEKYFSSKGYVSAQFFYKDIVSFVFPGQDLAFDFSPFPRPTNFPVGGGTVGRLSQPINTGGGRIYGAELSTTIPFDLFASALEGFGTTGGVGYTISRVRNETGQLQQIPGYSKFTASGTLFYEKSGFSVRGSVRHRSGFLGDFSGFGGNLTRRQALSETIVDAQVGYDFGKLGPLAGLSFYVQAQNLTDAPFVSVANPTSPLQVIDHQTFGRRIYVGATLKF